MLPSAVYAAIATSSSPRILTGPVASVSIFLCLRPPGLVEGSPVLRRKSRID